VISDSVTSWYLAPGRLWGAYFSDDFFAAAAIMTIVSLISLFWKWIQMAITGRDSQLIVLRE
jgi:hypothetical protein